MRRVKDYFLTTELVARTLSIFLSLKVDSPRYGSPTIMKSLPMSNGWVIYLHLLSSSPCLSITAVLFARSAYEISQQISISYFPQCSAVGTMFDTIKLLHRIHHWREQFVGWDLHQMGVWRQHLLLVAQSSCTCRDTTQRRHTHAHVSLRHFKVPKHVTSYKQFKYFSHSLGQGLCAQQLL